MNNLDDTVPWFPVSEFLTHSTTFVLILFYTNSNMRSTNIGLEKNIPKQFSFIQMRSREHSKIFFGIFLLSFLNCRQQFRIGLCTATMLMTFSWETGIVQITFFHLYCKGIFRIKLGLRVKLFMILQTTNILHNA